MKNTVNDYRNVSNNAIRNFSYNCGMHEHQLATLYNLPDQSPDGIYGYFKWLWSQGYLRGAFLLSDGGKKSHIHDSLAKVGVAVELGKNSNSYRNIYCFLVSKNSIKAYEEANIKPTSEEISSKKAVKKLSTTNKKSTSKPLASKKRVAAHAF